MKKNCLTCEFNFGEVCASHGFAVRENGKDLYGMPIEEAKVFSAKGCIDWNISFEAFCKMRKSKSQSL